MPLQIRDSINAIAHRYARLMAERSKRNAAGAVEMRTGKTVRSIKTAIKTDPQTGWVYAFGVRASKTAFVLNHGLKDSKVRAHTKTCYSGKQFAVRQHTRSQKAHPFIFDAIRSLKGRAASEMAKAGAEKLVKIGRFLE